MQKKHVGMVKIPPTKKLMMICGWFLPAERVFHFLNPKLQRFWNCPGPDLHQDMFLESAKPRTSRQFGAEQRQHHWKPSVLGKVVRESDDTEIWVCLIGYPLVIQHNLT